MPFGALTAGGLPGPPGEPGDSVYIEYSVDGTSNWHTMYVAGDKYMRVRIGTDGDWSPAMKFIGDQGTPGSGSLTEETGIYVATNYSDIATAIADMPEGTTLIIPPGLYTVNSKITVNKRIQIFGTSNYGTKIFCNGDFTLFEVTVNNVYFKDLVIGSDSIAANTANIHFKNTHYHKVENVTMYGGYIGIWMEGSLQCTIEDFRTGLSGPFGSTPAFEYGIYGNRDNSVSINGLSIKNPQMNGGGKYGIYISDSGEGDGHIIGGVIQGYSHGGINLTNVKQGFEIRSVHLESGVSKITLSGCNNVRISGCFIASNGGIIGTGCKDITVDNTYAASGIIFNNTNDSVRISNCSTNTKPIEVEATNSEISNIIDYGNSEFHCYDTQGFHPNKSYRNMVDGMMESWINGIPLGFSAYPSSVCLSKSTNAKFGNYSCKVERIAGYNTVSLVYELDYNRFCNPFEDGRSNGLMLTVRVWVYVPAVNSYSPQITLHYPPYDGSIATHSRTFSELPTEQWTPISATFRMKNNTTSCRIQIGAWATGDIGDYCLFDGVEVVEGTTCTPIYDDSRGVVGDLRVGGRFITSNIITTSGTSTPSVEYGNILKTNNSSPVTITNFTDGVEGQEIKVIFGDGNTSVNFGNAYLKGNSSNPFTGTIGDHMTCILVDNVWYCDVSNN
ncbi:hypothetical protein GF312_02175 [Candidatus Poribacteria bacterium]|nr:hypothetical protein [Candidatus Poribacteria bacterium]